MTETIAKDIKRLIHSRQTAALGTLHGGAPYVSMVPYALRQDGAALIIHVSKLAAHTNDMLLEPRVSILITANEATDTPPQALPRLTIQGLAKPIDTGTDACAAAKRSYLERFPSAEPIFQLGDFSLFAITPTAIRWIAGFGQAHSLTPEKFAEIIEA